jgi:hypothetical protein
MQGLLSAKLAQTICLIIQKSAAPKKDLLFGPVGILITFFLIFWQEVCNLTRVLIWVFSVPLG